MFVSTRIYASDYRLNPDWFSIIYLFPYKWADGQVWLYYWSIFKHWTWSQAITQAFTNKMSLRLRPQCSARQKKIDMSKLSWISGHLQNIINHIFFRHAKEYNFMVKRLSSAVTDTLSLGSAHCLSDFGQVTQTLPALIFTQIISFPKHFK